MSLFLIKISHVWEKADAERNTERNLISTLQGIFFLHASEEIIFGVLVLMVDIMGLSAMIQDIQESWLLPEYFRRTFHFSIS